MKKIVYIDMDCVARQDDIPGLGVSPITFSPGIFQSLSRLVSNLDYQLILLRSETHPAELVNDVIKFCSNEQITFEEVLSPVDISPRLKYAKDEVSCLICNPGFAYIDMFKPPIHLINETTDKVSILQAWTIVFSALSANKREGTVTRKTSETDITCFVNLDGSGVNEISTGLGFFDHMLQQIARHGNIDLTVRVKGDLHIDEHHTIEDVGLALGAAFLEALGNKKGIERYGFLLPMDDCLAQVAIDFGGRPWFVWDADFKREKIGDMPSEMFHHFFKSFSDTAKCNLNIKATGENEHHKIESIFKAFAKSIRMAVSKTNQNSIPSTKGIL